MAALTAGTKARNWRARGVNSYKVTSGEVVYFGGLIGVDDTDGFADPWQDTAATDMFLGVAIDAVHPGTGADADKFGSVDGSKTGPAGETPEVMIDERGVVFEKINVTTSAQGDLGQLVYCATDNPVDMKVAANTNTEGIGRITRFYSGDVCDVELFTPAEYLIHARRALA